MHKCKLTLINIWQLYIALSPGHSQAKFSMLHVEKKQQKKLEVASQRIRLSHTFMHMNMYKHGILCFTAWPSYIDSLTQHFP